MQRATGRGEDNKIPDEELQVQGPGGAALRRARAVRVHDVAAVQPGPAAGRRAGGAGAPHQRARPRARHHPRRPRRLPQDAPGRLAPAPGQAHRGGTRPARRSHLASVVLRLNGSHGTYISESVSVRSETVSQYGEWSSR